MQKKHHIFPNLNGIRFLAAAIVITAHIEQVKELNKLPNLMQSFSFYKNEFGLLGVTLFFVLSGFLITHLLILEKKRTGKIDLKSFYLRRALRIWPLYFFVLIISLLISGTSLISLDFLFGVLFCPNVFHSLYHSYAISPQIWSLGVEEQFYIFWPLLFIVFPRKITTIYLIFFFIGYSVLPYALGYYSNNINELTYYLEIDRILQGAKFNSMAIGCLAAFVYNYSFGIIKRLFYSRLFEIMVVFSTIGLWLFGIQITHLKSEVFSFLFVIMILSLTNPNSTFTFLFNSKIANYLGSISYGLYMYHYMVIIFIIHFFSEYFNFNSVTGNIVFYFISIMSTIILSDLSFRYLEGPFLRLKLKYTIK
jgi:peptidoglycan/LPS O-acetylase OafA/YrhL